MLSTSDMKTYSTDCLSSYCAQVFPADLQNHAAYFILSLMCFSRPMNLGHFHSCTQQDVDTFSPLTAWGCNDKPQLEVPQFKAALVLKLACITLCCGECVTKKSTIYAHPADIEEH